MKNLLIIIVVAICLTACGDSKEVKAEKLAKKALNSVIVNMDTYEPIETKIDSAFAPLSSPEVFRFYEQLPDQMRLFFDYQDEAKRLKTTIDLQEELDLSLGRNIYNQNKEDYENALKKIKEYDEKMEAFVKDMNQKAKEKPVFNGYRVKHTYRYVTKEGDKTIGHCLFLMNKDLTKVESMIDLDDEVIKAFMMKAEERNFGK